MGLSEAHFARKKVLLKKGFEISGNDSRHNIEEEVAECRE
jgi:hypothetical protein